MSFVYNLGSRKKLLTCIFLKTLSANAISHTKVENNHLRVFSFKHEEIGNAILHSLREMHFVKLRFVTKKFLYQFFVDMNFQIKLKT